MISSCEVCDAPPTDKPTVLLSPSLFSDGDTVGTPSPLHSLHLSYSAAAFLFERRGLPLSEFCFDTPQGRRFAIAANRSIYGEAAKCKRLCSKKFKSLSGVDIKYDLLQGEVCKFLLLQIGQIGFFDQLILSTLLLEESDCTVAAAYSMDKSDISVIIKTVRISDRLMLPDVFCELARRALTCGISDGLISTAEISAAFCSDSGRLFLSSRPGVLDDVNT